MTLTGGPGGATTTSSSNSYAFTGLAANGNYTVTPTKTGFSFTPASAVVINLTSNRIANFIASQTPGSYSISGLVTANGAPLSGVTVALTGPQTGNTATGADGTYSFPALPSGDYTLTPARNGFAFSPPTTAVTLTGNRTISFAASTAKGTLSSNRSILHFGATPNGATTTGEQEIIISASDNLPLNWTVVSDKPWLKTTPSSGVGSGRIAVWLASSGLPSAGTATASLTVSSGDATNAPLTVQVVLAVSSAAGAPFGSFDTPVDGAGGLGSGFAVTGWALADLGVKKVQIWRDPVGVEPVHSNGMVFIGDALFVPNARPDVERLYPNHPANYRAGWGYMLLSNFLPNPGGPAGNGTYRLHAVAVDEDGHETDLGVKTITVDNAHWAKPLGAIDTPGPGATIAGSAYSNSGWALTPMPNKILNTGSSVIRVYVDGVFVGSPTYNEYRPDLASLFTNYANAAGAGGSYSMDTTKYANGLHTITWLVTDNGGRADGIGSRFFSILNSGPIAAGVSTDDQVEASRQLLQKVRQSARMIERPSAPSYRKGFTSDNPLSFIPSGGDGLLSPIELDELERVEIHLPAAPVGARWAGGVRINGEVRPLPAGSTLDDEDGVFYWQLGPGFLGEYQLEFSCQSGLETAAGTVIPIRVKARDGDRRQ